jgi:hypothetical protein
MSDFRGGIVESLFGSLSYISRVYVLYKINYHNIEFDSCSQYHDFVQYLIQREDFNEQNVSEDDIITWAKSALIHSIEQQRPASELNDKKHILQSVLRYYGR